MVLPRDRFFYSNFTGTMDSFFAHHCVFILKKLPEVPEIAKMQLYMMTSL